MGERITAATVGTLIGLSIAGALVYAFRAEIGAAVKGQIMGSLPAGLRGLL